MIKKILIANRGEIALRILRAAKTMNKQVVAAYSQVDKHLLHLRYADDTICIGERDYLRPNDIVMAAKSKGCDAIHPGYGFLSENADFASLVESEGLIFVGPTPGQMAQLADKSAAKLILAEYGLPLVPGSDGALKSVEHAQKSAQSLGYPVMIKASFGGGGRGIRLVHNEAELTRIFSIAAAEAEANFGQGDIYLEKYLTDARHIEVQLLGDGLGNVVHLGTRDCSIQRRHQKVIEEAPAVNVAPELCAQLCAASVAALSKLKYRNAATLEFLVDDQQFYFLEINTRLQVEHTVTEMISGLDLVQEQIRLAEGVSLLNQTDLTFSGCAIECRINAEDQAGHPSPGRVTHLHLPGGPGVRIDTHLYKGYVVPHQYDSMIAKLICHGKDRVQALHMMRQALDEIVIEGFETNLTQLRDILHEPEYNAGRFSTQYLTYNTE